MGITRRLTPTGRYSGYVTLPKAFLRALGWRKGQRLAINRRKGAVVIRDARTKKRK